MPLELNLSLCLPTDELSVPVVRHICTYALSEVGVHEVCQSDISLALTEACTNVLDHATQDGEAYEVDITIDDERCTIWRAVQPFVGSSAAGWSSWASLRPSTAARTTSGPST